MNRHELLLERLDVLYEESLANIIPVSEDAWSSADQVAYVLRDVFGPEHMFVVQLAELEGGYVFHFGNEREEWVLIGVESNGQVWCSFGASEVEMVIDMSCKIDELSSLLRELRVTWEGN